MMVNGLGPVVTYWGKIFPYLEFGMRYVVTETYTPMDHGSDRKRETKEFDTDQTFGIGIAIDALAALDWCDGDKEMILVRLQRDEQPKELAEQDTTEDDQSYFFQLFTNNGEYAFDVEPVLDN